MTTLLAALAVGGPATPVPFPAVTVRDRFWSPRMATNRTATVGHCLAQLERAGNLEDFRLAAAGATKGYRGPVYMDSDVYKVLEGAAMTLATHPDPALGAKLDRVIALVASAQKPDGYLDTWVEVNRPGQEFTNLRDNHELYCAGHLFEAAVAHHRATGKTSLLAIATKVADHLVARFGDRPGYPGHPECELALVKLSQETNDPRYLALAKRFVEARGTHFFVQEHGTPEADYDGTYWIDDVPIKAHREIKGHAVRAAYLMSGATDVARLGGDPDLAPMLDRVWRNAVTKRIFVTGGIGPSGSNEGFTTDYDLPNETAYQESCASIAMAQWGWRMGLLHADARYFDAVETSLYNATLAGVSLDGVRFNYTNPLASRGDHHRQAWFGTACCPPNLLRTLASFGGYAYATRGADVFVNLYVPGSVSLGTTRLTVEGDYPWDGHLVLRPEPAAPTKFAMRLRVPAWARSYEAKVNGTKAVGTVENGYLVLDRTWRKGDRIDLDLPMPVERVAAHPSVKDDLNRLAVRRGPLVYCLEGVDQPAPADEIVVPVATRLKPVFDPELLGGVVALDGEAQRAPEADWDRTLYRPVVAPEATPVRLIPYAYWDNRKPSPMQVWLPTVPPPAKTGVEARAALGLSFRSGNADPEGVRDGAEVKSSGEQPARLTHFWPHKGGEEWISYRWKSPIRAAGVRVYWFDDTGRGECRLPASWRVERLEGTKWVPIQAAYPVEKDKWTEVRFPPVATVALRLVVRQQDGWASGVHEWRVVEDEE